VKVIKKEAQDHKKELTMPSEHGDSEDPGVYGVIKPEHVSKTSQLNREYIVEGQLDVVDSRQEKIGQSIEPLDPDNGEIPLVDGASQLCSSFGPVVPINHIVLRRPRVIRGRLKSTIVVKDLNGSSFECELGNDAGSVMPVCPGMISGAVLMVQGTPGILSDRSAILNPLYQFLPKTFNIPRLRGLQNVRSAI
jgi:hypothetical protein